MNDERRQTLERLFDGEPVADDPRDAADDAESLAYLRRLSLLRELALRHDPAAAVPPRQSVFVPPRSRRRIFATVLALAASVLFMALMVHHGRRTDPEPASIPAAPAWPAAGTSVADARIASPRSPRPPLEVELYRWANESSPYRDDAAGVALSRVGSLEGRHASPGDPGAGTGQLHPRVGRQFPKVGCFAGDSVVRLAPQVRFVAAAPSFTFTQGLTAFEETPPHDRRNRLPRSLHSG